MEDIRASLALAAAEASLPPERFRPVGHPRWRPLLDDILDRFTRSGSRGPRWLWSELLQDPTTCALRDPLDALAVLRRVLPPDAPVWFVAEDVAGTKKRGSYWLFATDSRSIVHVLGEHPPFEYAIVGRHLDWMVAENHHDVLLAVGEPVASRLDALREARRDSPESPRRPPDP